MNCPRHQTVELAPMDSNGHDLERCPECEGLWVPGPAIDKLLGAGELLKMRSLCSVRESDLLCPVDGHRLGEGKIGPVMVDLCMSCNGLWLDPGELESLRSRRPLTPHQKTAPEGGIKPLEPVSASSELILYGLLGLF